MSNVIYSVGKLPYFQAPKSLIEEGILCFLTALGFKVVSNWPFEPHGPNVDLHDVSDEFLHTSSITTLPGFTRRSESPQRWLLKFPTTSGR